MDTKMNSWIVELETDPKTGDTILPLSDEMMADMGWEIGDTIEWIDNKNGSWTIRLKKKNLLTKITKYLTILRTYFTRSK
jgi:hypothetical protein